MPGFAPDNCRVEVVHPAYSPRPFDTKSIIKTLNQILRLQLIKEQSISVINQKSGTRSFVIIGTFTLANPNEMIEK